MQVLHSTLSTIRFCCSAYLSLLVFLEISWAGLPRSSRTVLSWWPVVPLGPGGFLRHLACPKASFSAPYFTSFSLPIWDLFLRLGLSSVSRMPPICRLTSTARRARPYVRKRQ